MFRRLVALSLIFAACSTAPVVTEPETSTNPASQAATTPAPNPTTKPVPSSEPDPLTDNAAVFVASLEETVADTVFSGAVLDSPEVFIAAGEIMCTRFDEGDTIDEILIDYLDGLLDADDELAEEDVILLAGGVLGASVQLFCPQHIELIEGQT